MNSDEQSIRDIVQKLVAAWNESDSVGFAAPFAEDAVFIHIFGGQLDGRTGIEAGHRFIFDTIYKGSRNAYTVLAIRFLRPDVAMLFAQAHLQYFQNGEPRELHARPTLILTKDQGHWTIAALHNTKITELPV